MIIDSVLMSSETKANGANRNKTFRSECQNHFQDCATNASFTINILTVTINRVTL